MAPNHEDIRPREWVLKFVYLEPVQEQPCPASGGLLGIAIALFRPRRLGEEESPE